MQKELELRMYFLTMYQLVGIQKGIQCGHAVEEYSDKYGTTKKYKNYRKYKTWIILNGGTSNSGKESYSGMQPELGTMEQHLQLLKDNDINHAPFYEPDLNYALSAIAFLVDERVFNKEDYPDFVDYLEKIILWSENKEQKNIEYIKFKTTSIEEVKVKFNESYKNWLDLIGGKRNEFLREFLKDKKLA